MAVRSGVPVIHIDIEHDSASFRIRALINGEASPPPGKSLRDPELYSRVLRGAFKLGRAGADA
jgi:hypothetical protein